MSDDAAAVGEALAKVRTLRNRGHVREAFTAAERAAARWPEHRAVKAARADLLVRTGRLAEAERVVAEVLAEDAQHAGALIARGDLAAARGRHEAALADYRLAARAPGALRAAPHVMRKQARALARLGRGDEALAVLDEALARHPGEVGLAVERGWLLAGAGRHAEAAALAEALAAAHAGDAAVRGLALELRTRGRPSGEVARELDGVLCTLAGRADAQLWAVRARRASEQGDWPRAAESWMAVHALDGARRPARRMAGFAYRKAGQPALAARCLEPEFLANPGDHPVRACLLASLADNGESERAIALVERALAERPDLRGLWGVRRKLLAGRGS